MRLFLSLSFILIVGFANNAISSSFLMDQVEEEIHSLLENLRQAENDGQREESNALLLEKMRVVLREPGVMDHPFSSLQSMSTLKSPDAAFRIFNWNVESETQVHKHFCFVVIPGGRAGKPNRVIEFTEDNFNIPRHPDKVLTPDHWYGALYYKIIPVKRGNKNLYTMMGYSGNDRSTNEKMLDVFYFKGKSLRLGYPLYQKEKESAELLNRVFFEYSNSAFMSLNLNEKLDQIVFDHLSPEDSKVEGFREFYVPDMSYDAYQWNGRNWEYVEDVIAYNDQNRRYKAYKPGSSSATDSLDTDYINVKNEWINPVDKKSPIENGRNAIAPIERPKNTDQPKAEKEKKKRVRYFGKKRGKPRSAIRND